MRKSKSFTLVCGTEEDWYRNVSVRIRNDGTFRNRSEVVLHNREVQKESSRKCYHKNPELTNAYYRNWRLHNDDTCRVIKERYRNSERGRETERKYKDSHRDLYRKSEKKYKSEKRGLGFIELNVPFRNSHAHHINREFILYIPAKLHNSVKHNIETGKGMMEINEKAFLWLASQEDLFLF